MLQRIDYLINKGVDFALETTLSTRSYMQTIQRARQRGYVINLYYVWISSAEISQERVAARVARGGHNIPPEVIERRFGRSISNLVNLYLPIVNVFGIINNAGTIPEIVATGRIGLETKVFNEQIWAMIQSYETDRK